MESSDEQHIAEGLRSGDIASWQAFYDAFAETVWRIVAIRLGPRVADISDVVQETFLEAARSAHGFDSSRGELGLWLGGIARRQVGAWWRREERHNRLAHTDGTSAAATEARQRLSDYLQGRMPEPFELLQQSETASLVRQVLAEMPPDHAGMLMAKYMDGLTMEVMAAEMGLSLEAVRSKLARARRAFRRLFQRHPEELEQSTVQETE